MLFLVVHLVVLFETREEVLVQEMVQTDLELLVGVSDGFQSKFTTQLSASGL